MRLSDTFYRIRNENREVGPWRTLRHVFRQLYRRVVPIKVPVHPFDTEHGVDTGGVIAGRQLATGHVHDKHNIAYWATAPSLMRGSLERWQEFLAGTGYVVGDYTFFDLGSGKGRTVLLASETGFRRAVGIELSPELTRIAQQNIARWKQRMHACNDLEAIHGDALMVPLPDTAVLLYLFNPFDAQLMQLLLERMKSLSHERSAPIDILYTKPDHAALFDAIPNMQSLWKGAVPFTAKDSAADAFGKTSHECFIYRLHPGMAQ